MAPSLQRHIREILRTGTLTAVCDTDPERLSEYMTMYHIPGYASFDTLMSAGLTADIVVLCTPNGYHASQSIQAMQQGYHVICEKPMALKSKDAALMLAVAKQTNKSLSIVKQNRFNGPILQLQQWIASGASGQVYSPIHELSVEPGHSLLYLFHLARYQRTGWRHLVHPV
ncbi:MAG: Gfo/Idh/MocA family oxidoreductase [Saprospiraceae bacterium]|nr:Gfo/Idh/MocA family oxidoreductase [Saprospiraceae bacterium]